MSGTDDLREYAEFLTLLTHAGVESGGMVDELALFAHGFEDRLVGASEIWEDPEDPAAAGGLWIGREEALRRIGVRASQGRRVPLPDGWSDLPKGGGAEG